MEKGTFACCRLRVEGIYDNKTEPFYSGPKVVAVVVDSDANVLEPMTVLYLEPKHVVSFDEMVKAVRKMDAKAVNS